jgi:hypothetical protein
LSDFAVSREWLHGDRLQQREGALLGGGGQGSQLEGGPFLVPTRASQVLRTMVESSSNSVRRLNRVGARGLIQLGFVMLCLGYGASSWINEGLL